MDSDGTELDQVVSAMIDVLPPVRDGDLRLFRVEPSAPPAPTAEWLMEALAESGDLAARGRWFTDRSDYIAW